MDKRIKFGTKKELNALRHKEFLALSGHERVLHFIKMIEWSHNFYGSKPYINPDNFLIDLTKSKHD